MRFLAVVVFGSFVQSSYASVYLIANLGSAKCDSGGHLQNLTLTSVTCDYSEKCHYGDHVFVTGQGTTMKKILLRTRRAKYALFFLRLLTYLLGSPLLML